MGWGILSSFGEMEWSAAAHPSQECREMGGIVRDYPDLANPKLMGFDPRAAWVQPWVFHYLGFLLRYPSNWIESYTSVAYYNWLTTLSQCYTYENVKVNVGLGVHLIQEEN